MGLLTSFSLVDWAIVGVSLIAAVYLYLTWTFNHWKKRGVPFVKNPLPLFGHMKRAMLDKQPLGDIYMDMYKQLKGCSFGGYFNFRTPEILVCDPDLIKTVMTKDFSSFHDNLIDVSIDADPMFGRNPFCLRGDRWKTVRSQLTPAFTPGKIKPLFPLINEVCRDMVQYLEKEEAAGTDGLEAKELSSKFTTDSVATCAYGLNGNSFTDPKAEFRELGKGIFSNTGWWRQLQVTIMFLAPKIGKFCKFRFFDEKVTNFFRNLVRDTMKHREENNVTRNDFLQLLMQLKAKGRVDDGNADNPTHNKFTDEDVAAQALTFFTDGFETSATALSFALYELAVNADICHRLKAEVDSTLSRNEGKLTYEMLQECPYLEMVLAETLRKYPPGPFLARQCTKPYDLPTPDGRVYRVVVGTSVTFPILALHHDPEYYPDPERFDPERFTEENKAKRHPYAYLPFGGGPRLCIGNRFATTQLKAAIASIVSNFEIQLCKRTHVPIVMDPNHFMPLAKDGIWIKFVKHAKETQ